MPALGGVNSTTSIATSAELAAAAGQAGATDVAVADGGTGASTAAGARTNLGLGTAAVAATGDFEAAGGIATHAGAADPHTGYRLESADHSHASTGLQGGQVAGSDLSGTPGGELGGTWASPTVDATHAGSTHSAATDTHIADTSAAHAASAIAFTPNGSIAATDVQAAIQEVRDEAGGGGAPTTVDYLVGTADAGLSAEIVVGTSPGGELGGTWASPTVDATHSGSAHHTQSHDHSAAGDGQTVVPVHLTLPTGAESTAGRIREDTTTHIVSVYDTQRERGAGDVGWVPYAFPPGYAANASVATATTLAAAGGSIACPVFVPGHMLLQALQYRQGDATLLRTMEWQLYLQYLNNANAGENTLAAVTGATGTDSLTAGAASTRTSAVTSPPIYLAPGTYWLVVRNTHATNSFAILGPGAGTMQNNLMQTKTLGSALGSTLDFVAATWTKTGSTPLALILQGRVFGQAVSF